MQETQQNTNQGNDYLKFYEIPSGNFYKMYIGINAGLKLTISIKEAKKSIKIVSPFLGETEVEKLREKKLGGLEDITLITAVSNDTWSKPSQIEALRRLIHQEKIKDVNEYEYTANFKLVFFDGNFLHEKIYIVDDAIAYIGSYNFTKAGMEKNYETSITFTDTETLKTLTEYFARLYDASMKKWDISDLGKVIYSYHF